MADLLIRDVPDDVVTAIDADARRLGLSRSEYLRRLLAQIGSLGDHTVTAADLTRFGHTFADLADDEVMGEAWR